MLCSMSTEGGNLIFETCLLHSIKNLGLEKFSKLEIRMKNLACEEIFSLKVSIKYLVPGKVSKLEK